MNNDEVRITCRCGRPLKVKQRVRKVGRYTATTQVEMKCRCGFRAFKSPGRYIEWTEGPGETVTVADALSMPELHGTRHVVYGCGQGQLDGG